MCGRYRVSRLELEADRMTSILEQIAEARGKAEAKPAAAQPAVVTRPYDPELADAILQATLDLHGGEKEWAVNFAAIENGGTNAKGEPGVMGALKTERYSPEHPKAVVLYFGNRGPKVVLSGFSEDEVNSIFEAATEAYVDATVAATPA